MVYPYNNTAEQLHWLFQIYFTDMGKCSGFDNGDSRPPTLPVREEGQVMTSSAASNLRLSSGSAA